MELKFYQCPVCKKIIWMVKSTVVPTICCGTSMRELVPGTTDAAAEKHVPVYELEGGRVVVTVGSQAHPMTSEHYIEWIALQTTTGTQWKALSPDSEPKATFAIAEGEEVVSVFAYCNLHSLWKS